MRIEINIRNSHFLVILLFIIAASAIGLVVAYGGTNPVVMGHTWGEMACPGCIASSNLADSSVTGAKIQDGTVAGADIQDGSITSADVSSIDGGKVTGTVPNAEAIWAGGKRMVPRYWNLGEDGYGGFSYPCSWLGCANAGDTCNGDGTNAYSCSASESRTCRDYINYGEPGGGCDYYCGRDVTCKQAIVLAEP